MEQHALDAGRVTNHGEPQAMDGEARPEPQLISGRSKAAGLLLIVVGAGLLALQLLPELASWLQVEEAWPLFIIGLGIFVLMLGLLTGNPGTAIPATVLVGIGGLLLWQSMTGNWASWAYAWTLIPGFVGLGQVGAALLSRRPGGLLRAGLTLLTISGVLFVVFGSAFGAFGVLGPYWPALLIVLGAGLFVQAWRHEAP